MAKPIPDRSNRKAERNCSVASGSENWRSSLWGLQTPVSQKRRNRSTSPERSTKSSEQDFQIDCVLHRVLLTILDVFQQFLVKLCHVLRSSWESDAVASHCVLNESNIELVEK